MSDLDSLLKSAIALRRALRNKDLSLPQDAAMDAVILADGALKVNPSVSLLAWSKAGDERLVEILDVFFTSSSIMSFAQEQDLQFLLAKENQFFEYCSITELSIEQETLVFIAFCDSEVLTRLSGDSFSSEKLMKNLTRAMEEHHEAIPDAWAARMTKEQFQYWAFKNLKKASSGEALEVDRSLRYLHLCRNRCCLWVGTKDLSFKLEFPYGPPEFISRLNSLLDRGNFIYLILGSIPVVFKENSFLKIASELYVSE